jgi:pseudaminic acid cytidylyltransferase
VTVVAIIPARGGSKRIPGKNVRPFLGRPLIAYSIAAACESRLFDRILVSTDSEEIARVATELGAEAPFRRPAELSDDHTPTDPVLQHALRWLESQGTPADYFCCIYATAPFVRAEDIRRGFQLLRDTGAATAFSVTSFPYPIFRALRIVPDGRVEMFWPENFAKRSQDLREAFHDAGQFYWADTKRYWEEGRLFGSNAVPVILPRHLVQDIDTEEDWVRAERLYIAHQERLSGA